MVRNISIAKHRQTKEPLNLFFVDLEPAGNNKEIYKINKILNSIIQTEPPRKNKNGIQCMRCQQYDHTKAYCNRPFLCVKCAGPHDTASCRKSRDTPAICALCGGPHPANYRGCEYYHRLYKNSRHNINNLTHQSTIINTNEVPVLPNISQPGHRMSCANVVKNDKGITRNNQNNTDNEDISEILGKFLDDFKRMFK
jgi:hypothetical protein